MSQMAFYFDGTRCTGCKTCETACKDFNDLSVDFAFRKVYEATLGETSRDESGVISTSCVSYTISMACNHCENPACVENCPQGALSKDTDTGLVVSDQELCIGCGTCVLACPYGAPKVDEEALKSLKCHGCAERLAAGMKPVCVEACPSRALGFGVAEEMEALGERANIAPLPDASETTPSFFINPSSDAQPVGGAEVANPLEVL